MDSEIYERKNETITGDREDWLGWIGFLRCEVARSSQNFARIETLEVFYRMRVNLPLIILSINMK